jgi:predicted O-methyltransferase YrrM
MAPSPFARSIDPLEALYPPPAWAAGALPRHDAAFLVDVIHAHQPATIVEIGVASGVSSAVILSALDALPMSASRTLHSCDIVPRCYFDSQYATGEAVQSMYPKARARWVLNTDLDTRRLSQTAPPASIDLLFIDANHYHPWPLLDLLHMTVAARPWSWVVLHDINLPEVSPAFQAWGAKWLFEAWPLAKIEGGGPDSNIGAVQLPGDPRTLIPMAERLLQRPWEFPPTLWHVALPECLSPVQELVRTRLAA